MELAQDLLLEEVQQYNTKYYWTFFLGLHPGNGSRPIDAVRARAGCGFLNCHGSLAHILDCHGSLNCHGSLARGNRDLPVPPALAKLSGIIGKGSWTNVDFWLKPLDIPNLDLQINLEAIENLEAIDTKDYIIPQVFDLIRNYATISPFFPKQTG